MLDLSLTHIIGCSTQSNTQLACTSVTGDVAYVSVCHVILYNPEKHKQVSYFSVEGVISCIKISPNGQYLAVGYLDPESEKPSVVVFDIPTGQIKVDLTVSLNLTYGVSCMTFTNDSSILIVIGFKQDKLLQVFDIDRARRIGSGKFSQKILSVAMHPSGTFFVTSGIRHLKFWDTTSLLQYSADCSKLGVSNECGSSTEESTPPLITLVSMPASLSQQGPDFENFVDVAFGPSKPAVVSGGPVEGEASVGSVEEVKPGHLTYGLSSTGRLCAFRDRVMEHFVNCHTKHAFALTTIPSNSAENDEEDIMVCAACSDGILRIYSSSLSFRWTLPLPPSVGCHGVTVADSLPSISPGDVSPSAVAVRFLSYGSAGSVNGTAEGTEEPHPTRLLAVVYGDMSLFLWEISDFSAALKYRSFVGHCGAVAGVARTFSAASVLDSALLEAPLLHAVHADGTSCPALCAHCLSSTPVNALSLELGVRLVDRAPTFGSFLTAAEDGSLRLWNASTGASVTRREWDSLVGPLGELVSTQSSKDSAKAEGEQLSKKNALMDEILNRLGTRYPRNVYMRELVRTAYVDAADVPLDALISFPEDSVGTQKEVPLVLLSAAIVASSSSLSLPLPAQDQANPASNPLLNPSVNPQYQDLNSEINSRLRGLGLTSQHHQWLGRQYRPGSWPLRHVRTQPPDPEVELLGQRNEMLLALRRNSPSLSSLDSSVMKSGSTGGKGTTALLGSLTGLPGPLGFSARALAVDGLLAAVGDANGLLRIFDIRSGALLCAVRADPGCAPIAALASTQVVSPGLPPMQVFVSATAAGCISAVILRLVMPSGSDASAASRLCIHHVVLVDGAVGAVPVSHLSLSKDGTLLVLGGTEGLSLLKLAYNDSSSNNAVPPVGIQSVPDTVSTAGSTSTNTENMIPSADDPVAAAVQIASNEVEKKKKPVEIVWSRKVSSQSIRGLCLDAAGRVVYASTSDALLFVSARNGRTIRRLPLSLSLICADSLGQSICGLASDSVVLVDSLSGAPVARSAPGAISARTICAASAVTFLDNQRIALTSGSALFLLSLPRSTQQALPPAADKLGAPSVASIDKNRRSRGWKHTRASLGNPVPFVPPLPPPSVHAAAAEASTAAVPVPIAQQRRRETFTGYPVNADVGKQGKSNIFASASAAVAPLVARASNPPSAGVVPRLPAAAPPPLPLNHSIPEIAPAPPADEQQSTTTVSVSVVSDEDIIRALQDAETPNASDLSADNFSSTPSPSLPVSTDSSTVLEGVAKATSVVEAPYIAPISASVIPQAASEQETRRSVSIEKGDIVIPGELQLDATISSEAICSPPEAEISETCALSVSPASTLSPSAPSTYQTDHLEVEKKTQGVENSPEAVEGSESSDLSVTQGGFRSFSKALWSTQAVSQVQQAPSSVEESSTEDLPSANTSLIVSAPVEPEVEEEGGDALRRSRHEPPLAPIRSSHAPDVVSEPQSFILNDVSFSSPAESVTNTSTYLEATESALSQILRGITALAQLRDSLTLTADARATGRSAQNVDMEEESMRMPSSSETPAEVPFSERSVPVSAMDSTGLLFVGESIASISRDLLAAVDLEKSKLETTFSKLESSRSGPPGGAGGILDISAAAATANLSSLLRNGLLDIGTLLVDAYGPQGIANGINKNTSRGRTSSVASNGTDNVSTPFIFTPRDLE